MHGVAKWPNMLWKSCVVHGAGFLKYVWPFFNIMHGRVKTAGHHVAHKCNMTIKAIISTTQKTSDDDTGLKG